MSFVEGDPYKKKKNHLSHKILLQKFRKEQTSLVYLRNLWTIGKWDFLAAIRKFMFGEGKAETFLIKNQLTD